MTELPFAFAPGQPVWLPGDNNLLAATGGMEGSGNTATPVAGTQYLEKIVVRGPFPVSTIWFSVSGAGSGASSGSFVGVMSPTGQVLGTSADIGASLTSAAVVPVTLPSPVPVGALPFFWVAFLSNLAVTQPTLRCFMASSLLVNANLTAPNYRSCTNGTGLAALTAFTPSANVNASNPFWFGVS